ncbi:MAG: hypothetical protein ACRCVN_02875 [Spirochaetia bacterium]
MNEKKRRIAKGALLAIIFLTLFAACRNKKVLTPEEAILQDQVYFYSDLPEIRSYTTVQTGERLCIFTVKLILAYPANNRRIALEISRKRVPIIDSVRNQLERYPESAFLGDTVNQIKQPLLDSINKVLFSGKIMTILLESVDVYPVPRVK